MNALKQAEANVAELTDKLDASEKKTEEKIGMLVEETQANLETMEGKIDYHFILNYVFLVQLEISEPWVKRAIWNHANKSLGHIVKKIYKLSIMCQN